MDTGAKQCIYHQIRGRQPVGFRSSGDTTVPPIASHSSAARLASPVSSAGSRTAIT
ncbi:hypothetical protein [Aeromonas dhakensis]|uniref:hypothetical protein n=1 Tax=Aeromonas dhakensis TaxID=196024 RepID=UPI003441F50F